MCTHVNCLVGMFRKYDDIIRQQPGPTWLFKHTTFNDSEFTNNRKWALEAMLPRWAGFCGPSRAAPFYSRFTAEQALKELYTVVDSIKFLSVCEDNLPETNLTPRGFTDKAIAEVRLAVSWQTHSMFISICCEILFSADNISSRKTSTGRTSKRTTGEMSPTFICCNTRGFGPPLQSAVGF